MRAQEGRFGGGVTFYGIAGLRDCGVRVEGWGKCGDEVEIKTDTNNPDDRPENQLSPPDIAISLGGTKDLAYNRPPDTTLEDMKATVAIPISKGARVLLMTVPECHAKNASLNTRRDALNGLIKNYAEENKDVFVFDLFDKIKYHSMGEEDRHEIWDDGLRLTAEAYRWMGVLAAMRVFEILGAAGGTVE
ncbi:hypothetical protein G7Y89_g14677 [Cudoniella acicularis]|uniref:SGNH hydrolase-type esterase domain-containing protein n=1 Tax=Cudoniella acicularis TaxID=354080 RepID=A0A8H4QZR4_9HELO|nr:hypothetical protein G7Y89_g14677 [Cudoniella acicularis]